MPQCNQSEYLPLHQTGPTTQILGASWCVLCISLINARTPSSALWLGLELGLGLGSALGFELRSELVRVRVRVRYVFEPLMTTGIEPGSEHFHPRPWLARPKVAYRIKTFVLENTKVLHQCFLVRCASIGSWRERQNSHRARLG